MPTHEPLIYEYRNQTIDNVHMGYICIVDENSGVRFHIGDPEEYVYYRSASKPIQALPVIGRNLDKEYGITEEESVVFSASHSGEPYFIEKLESIFIKAGLSEDQMIMQPTYPLDKASAFELKKNGLPPRKMYHNCAGKHAGTMLLQRALGGRVGDYWQPDSLAQREIRRAVMALSETDDDTTRLGTDGCGVPVFAVGIRHIATGFKNLACIDTISDKELRDTANRYIPRINRFPHMISGSRRICTILDQDPNIIAKGGAAALYGCGLKRERLGIAFKISSGHDTVWPLVLSSIFRQIGGVSPETMERLAELQSDQVFNDNGSVVGNYQSLIQINL